MAKAVLLLLAFASCVGGMTWLALAMDVHWRQVRNDAIEPSTARILRSVGGTAILASLVLCLQADHASMAALVWIMMTAAAAVSVAFTLSWRPRLLSPLIAWVSVQRT